MGWEEIEEDIENYHESVREARVQKLMIDIFMWLLIIFIFLLAFHKTGARVSHRTHEFFRHKKSSFYGVLSQLLDRLFPDFEHTPKSQ